MSERIAIVGSRDYPNCKQVQRYVSGLSGDIVIVTGCAQRGVDSWVRSTALALHIDLIVKKADWTKYGKAAGPIRNNEIIEACDRIVAFWHKKSKGTFDCLRKAISAGKPILVHYG
jgi:hypothetical protein